MKKNKAKTWEEKVADFKNGKIMFLRSRIPVYQKKDTEYLSINQKPNCTIHNQEDWQCNFKKIFTYGENEKIELWKIEHTFRVPVLGTW